MYFKKGEFRKNTHKKSRDIIKNQSDGDEKIALYGAAKNADWIILLVQSKKDVMQPIYTNMLFIVIAGILMLFVLVAVFFVVSREIAEPIKRLKQRAEQGKYR